MMARPAVRVARSHDRAVTTATAPAPSSQPGGSPNRSRPLGRWPRMPVTAEIASAAAPSPRTTNHRVSSSLARTLLGRVRHRPGGAARACGGRGRCHRGRDRRLRRGAVRPSPAGGAAARAVARQPACRGRTRGGCRRWGKARRGRLQPTVGQGRVGTTGRAEVVAVEGDLEGRLAAGRPRRGARPSGRPRPSGRSSAARAGPRRPRSRCSRSRGRPAGCASARPCARPAARRRARRSPRRRRRPGAARARGSAGRSRSSGRPASPRRRRRPAPARRR